MILTYIQTHDTILKAVKLESTLLAERRNDQQGNSMFDDLVFDEEYLILFRDLFFDARANVTSACTAYMKDVSDITLFDTNNFEQDKDFSIQLKLPDTFVIAVNNSVDSKMKSYLVAYIMYRWLETKLPNESVVYLTRATTHLQDMKRYLEMRTSMKVKGSIY